MALVLRLVKQKDLAKIARSQKDLAQRLGLHT